MELLNSLPVRKTEYYGHFQHNVAKICTLFVYIEIYVTLLVHY